jgi:radial spoke head protein 9
VSLISRDSEIVPRGAYYKTSTSALSLNPGFSGISSDSLLNLDSYLHFRDGFSLDAEAIEAKISTFDAAVDIFEPISNDSPKGSWSIQGENGGSVVILKNLNWPGHVFYHAPKMNKFGSVYFGTGVKNIHLGFSL